MIQHRKYIGTVRIRRGGRFKPKPECEPLNGREAIVATVEGVEVTSEMIASGARAAWGNDMPPAVTHELVGRIYRAMEVARRNRLRVYSCALSDDEIKRLWQES